MKDILCVVSNHHRGRYKNADEKEFAEKKLKFLGICPYRRGVRLHLYFNKEDSKLYVVPEVYDSDNDDYVSWSSYQISEDDYYELYYKYGLS
jgi:hypothetical protein